MLDEWEIINSLTQWSSMSGCIFHLKGPNGRVLTTGGQADMVDLSRLSESSWNNQYVRYVCMCTWFVRAKLLVLSWFFHCIYEKQTILCFNDHIVSTQPLVSNLKYQQCVLATGMAFGFFSIRERDSCFIHCSVAPSTTNYHVPSYGCHTWDR
jgi:hypothetical protein